MAVTRREFLELNISLALVSLCPRAGTSETAALWRGDDEGVLSDIIYQFFPHPRLSNDVYNQVVEQVNTRIAQSDELTVMMNQAMESLVGSERKKWTVLTGVEKQELLKEIQQTPFFQFVLNEALSGVYRHPITWELLGFEGSSLEFGGYINKGFNDIDWLPE